MSKKHRKIPVQNSQFNEYSGVQQLLDSEQGLVKYSTAIVNKFANKMELIKRIKHQNGKILEFGAGTGFLAQIFKEKYGIKPKCVELDPNLISIVKEKNFECFQFLSQTNEKFDAIYTSNVLEHIEQDSSILSEFYEYLLPNGVVGIYVPANPILYSSMDQEIGHIRRYTRKELKTKIKNAGFEIEHIYFDDCIGFFASAAVKLLGYKKKLNLGSKKSLEFYDNFVYPLSRILDSLGFKYFLGKNLFAVAKKSTNSKGAL